MPGVLIPKTRCAGGLGGAHASLEVGLEKTFLLLRFQSTLRHFSSGLEEAAQITQEVLAVHSLEHTLCQRHHLDV